MTLTEEMLAEGNQLSRMNIPKGVLVMMVKRGKTIIVPNGQLPLEKGDILLFSSRTSFFRSFKKVTGETPNEYIKRLKKSSDGVSSN